MKHLACTVLIAGIATLWVGCASENEPAQMSQAEPTAPAVDDSAETMLVTLSVPNMT